MKKAYRLSACSLALMITLSVPSYGWNSRGHMMVAFVAYQHLSQKAKDRVDKLLLLNPDRVNWLKLIPAGTSPKDQRVMVFMIAATWPDRIKSLHNYTDDTPNPDRPDGKPSNKQNIGYSDHFKHKYWHFIDTPFSQDHTHLDPIPSPNAQTQIAVFRTVLASSKSDGLKSYDLSWLLHLVGDVHQPLHCAARFGATQPHGDNGGNSVKLTGSPSNLHSFWDDLFGNGDSPSDAVQIAQNLPQGVVAGNMDAGAWIKESFDDAQKDVYIAPIGAGSGPFTVTPAYHTDALKLAQERIVLAGVRLAKILNDELK